MDRITELRAAIEHARERTLATIETLAAGDWDTPVQSEGEGWTVRNVVSHLLDTETSQGMLIHRLLSDEETVPEDFDIDRWNRRVRKMPAQSPEALVAGLAESRVGLRGVLDRVQPEDLTRTGRHPGLGEIVSLERFLELLAWHERPHLGEITTGLGLDD